MTTTEIQDHDGFKSAMELWKRDTLFSSSTTEICNHKCFDTLTKLGESIIPKLLVDLAEYPWVGTCALLATIVKEIPFEVEKQDYGRLDIIASTWLWWGLEAGYYESEQYQELITKLNNCLKEAQK